jgi:hypothetical protein
LNSRKHQRVWPMLMEKKTAIRTASGRYGATLLDAYELADQVADIRADLQNLTSAVSRRAGGQCVHRHRRAEKTLPPVGG